LPFTLQAELTYRHGEFRPGLSIVVEAGRIQSVGSETAGEVIRLPRRALTPGLVNAHSHAFQRLLRGTTEWRAAEHDDFWVWREQMYGLVSRLTPEGLEDACALAFLEMLRAGITTVGEFHYLHRDRDGDPYDDPNELALRVIAAAERVGIRIVLLNSAYARGGAGRPLAGPQRRFEIGSIDRFLRETEDLEKATKARTLVTVGVAPHSVRALDRSQLQELARGLAGRAWPVHMHLAEQPAEVEACLAETGLRPVQLASEVGLLGPRFCAVHAIEVQADEIALLGGAGAMVCACPTTERDLGDGLVPADGLRRARVEFALGSDSNTQIDLLEDARSLELNLRLQRRQRVLVEPRGLAFVLFEAATAGGASALELRSGSIAPDFPADLISFDLDDPSLAGGEESLLPRLVFGGQTRAVSDVMVNGDFVVRDRRHARELEIGERFRRLATSLGAQDVRDA
jgi:formimidoylglutamate deiminase